MTAQDMPKNLPASTPEDRAALRRDVLDALSATGAALGAVEFIKTSGLTTSEVAGLAVVERHLAAALVALDALASGLGLQIAPAQPITGASVDRGRGHEEG